MVKATSSLPPVQRAVVIGGTAGITAAATQIGLGVGSSVFKNSEDILSIANSKHSDPDINRIPSPDIDNIFINSILEKDELRSPLEELLIYQFLLNLLILMLIIILLIIIFNRFILKYNLTLLSSFFGKYMSNNINELFKKYVNYSDVYNDRFVLILFIIITLNLFFIIFLNIFISSELLFKTDNYIDVYNYIHNQNNLLFFLMPVHNLYNKKV